MTVQQMSDEELNHWIVQHLTHDVQNRTAWDGHAHRLTATPFYATDLNACADMEQEIARRGIQDDYVLALHTVIDPEYDHVDSPSLRGLWQLLTATPRQRCESAYIALQEPQP